MKRKLLFIIMLFFVMITGSFAQMVTVKGTIVTASDNQPLVGVTVVEKGTTNGTITDVLGKYSITVRTDATLLVSFVGMKTQEIPVGNQSAINITMEIEETAIEEVVVTALGITREKKALGYSVSEVKGDKVSAISPINPVTALEGKVAGLNIAANEGASWAGTKVQIRGASTLRANNMPIFVVDGVTIDNELSGGNEWGGTDWGNNLKNLNSDEFESVSVLKGSAATALYGSRAMNGAIVIVTKKGQARKDLGVKLSERFSIKHPYAGPKFQNIYGEGAPAGYDTRYPDPFAPQNSFLINGAGEPYLEGTAGDWWVPMSYGHKMDGTQVRDYDGNWISYVPHPNNFLDAYENGYQNNTNLSLEGGGENSNFFVSFSNFREKGVIPRNTFDRNSVFAKINRKFNQFIAADFSVSYGNAVPRNPLETLGQYFITGNWARNYNTEYWMKHYKAAHGGVPQGDPYNDPGYQSPDLGIWFSLFENENRRTEQSLRMTGRVTLTFADWFNIAAEGYTNNYYTKGENKQLGQGYRNSGGSYELFHDTKDQYDGKIWLNFHKLVSQIDVRASVIAEHYQTRYSYSGAWTNGGLLVPGQYFIDNSKNQAGQNAYIGDQKNIESLYAFADLSWKSQIYLSITGRNDWSSALVYADGSGTNSYFYPSLSASWLFSETFQLPAWFTYGKLRASWAHVGRDVDPYIINPGFSRSRTVNSYNGDLAAFTFKDNVMPNLHLKPEDQKSIEFGVESHFIENRLGLDFTYYKSNTYNQVLKIPTPYESGVSERMINAGNIQNQGIELELTTTPVKKGNFSYFLNLTLARNRSKVISLYPGVTEYVLEGSWNYGNTRVASIAKVGGEYGVLVSDSDPQRFNNPGDANDPRNGKPLLTWNPDFRGAWMARSYEEREVGNMNPKFTGGVNTGFTYKNLRIEALFDIRIGGDISTYSGRYGTAYGLFESSLANRDAEHGGIEFTSSMTGNTYTDGIIPDGVFAPGTIVEMKDAGGNSINNDVSGMTYKEAYDNGLVDPTHASWYTYRSNSWSRGVINGAVLQENSYIGFREFSITYGIASGICQKLKVSSADISFIARDLGYLYKTLKDDLNPFCVRSNRSGAALEWQQTPYTRTIGLSLNVSF
jgi:iron complex outermembrane recepter protein